MKYLSLLFLFLFGCNTIKYENPTLIKISLTNVVCDINDSHSCNSVGKIVFPDSLVGRVYQDYNLLGAVGDTVLVYVYEIDLRYRLR